MGRHPTPTSILAARGSWRAKARLGEPCPIVGLPSAPEWISESGRQHWQEIGGMLADIGVMTNLDRHALALLVDALTMYIDARAMITTDGRLDESKMVTMDDKSRQRQSPAVDMMHKSWERVVKMAREFGLTPASRVGVKTGGAYGPQAQASLDGINKRDLFKLA